MKSLYQWVLVGCLVLLVGCRQKVATISEVDQEGIRAEVKDQFNQLVSAINQLNADAWSESYSRDGFLSAIVSTDYYGTRSAWVKAISDYFSTRERQRLEPLEVRVTALTADLALMTSEEKAEISLKNGDTIKSKHVFTMIWRKEQKGWKILHSHESWVDEQAK